MAKFREMTELTSWGAGVFARGGEKFDNPPARNVKFSVAPWWGGGLGGLPFPEIFNLKNKMKKKLILGTFCKNVKKLLPPLQKKILPLPRR